MWRRLVAARAGGWPEGRCIAAHSAGPTTALQAVVPPIRSLTMHRPSGLSWMPTRGAGRVGRIRLRRGAQTHFWMRTVLPEQVRDGRGSLGECAELTSAERVWVPDPSIKIASPLTQRDPPLPCRQWSPQYVRSRCIGPRACRGCRHAARGECGVVDFAEGAQAHFRMRTQLIDKD